MKKTYTPAKIEIVTLGTDDIVRTSFGAADNEGISPFSLLLNNPDNN